MSAHFHSFPRGAGATVTECPPAARFSLRLKADHRAAASTALGLDLPLRIGAVAGVGRRALMLGPDEWQIDGPPGDAPALPGGIPHALVDISARDRTFALEGPRAAELLSLGIARDLTGLQPGQGCRTVFDGVQVVLLREGADRFTLSVWRSFAPHVAHLLATGLREFHAGL